MARTYTRTDETTRSEIVDLYDSRAATIPEIAERYGVSPSSVKGYIRAAGKTRTPTIPASPAAKLASVAATTSILAASALATPKAPKPSADEIEERVNHANAATLATCDMLERLLREALVAFERPADSRQAAGLARALDQASIVGERITKLRRLTLKMDSFNSALDVVLPELPIRCMTDSETKAIRHRQALEDQGLDPDAIDARLAADDADNDQAEPGDVVEGDDEQPAAAPIEAAPAVPERFPVELTAGGKIRPGGKPHTGWL